MTKNKFNGEGGQWFSTKDGRHFFAEDEKYSNFDDGDDEIKEATLKETLQEKYSDISLPTLILPKKEYGAVYHTINANYYSKHCDNKLIIEYVGDYAYVAENNGYNEYRIIEKWKIK